MGDEMTQEDIDRLLSEMASGDNAGAVEEAASSSHELTQEEIDAMVSGPPDKGPAAKAAPDEQAFALTQQPEKKKKQQPAQSMQFSSFSSQKAGSANNDIAMILDVPMELTVELGRTNMFIKDILDLGPGSVVEINRLAGEPIELLVNGKVIAKGEVVVIDEKFGLRITELLNPSNEKNSKN